MLCYLQFREIPSPHKAFSEPLNIQSILRKIGHDWIIGITAHYNCFDKMGKTFRIIDLEVLDRLPIRFEENRR